MAGPYSLTMFDVTGTFVSVSNPSISGSSNTPVIQRVNALCTFTPRLAKGAMLFVADYLVTEAYSALQQINLVGNPTGGTWTLSYITATPTAALPWNATPTQVQTALRNLATIGGANVNVSAGVAPMSYDVAFVGTLGNQPIPALVGNADLLTTARGSGFCEITTTRTAMGSPQIVADTAIAMPPLTARIWDGVLSTINYTDTAGFQLVANTDIFAGQLDATSGALIYDVSFSKATYNGADQILAPFAFQAPTDDTAVCITDPDLVRQAYLPPNASTWKPVIWGPDPPLQLVGRRGWRERALAERRAS